MKKLWLVRETYDSKAYLFYAGRKPKRALIFCGGFGRERWPIDDEVCCCEKVFHQVSNIRLKPGEGPILVEIKEVKK